MASKIATCAGCRSAIMSRHYLACCLCAQVYDLECANMSRAHYFSKIKNEKVNTWKCPCCTSSLPKGDNTNTPISAAHSSRSRGQVDSYESSPMSGGSEPDNVCRGTVGSDTIKIPERSFLDDSCFLDSMRTIIRDELERIVVDRVAAIIAKAIAEHSILTTQPLREEILELKDRVAVLENQAKVSGQVLQVPASPAIFSSSEVRETSVTGSPTGRDPPDTIPITSVRSHVDSNIKDTRERSHPAPVSKPSVSSQSLSTEPTNNQESEWISVSRKRRPVTPAGVIRGAAAPGATKLEAADRRRFLHLYYVKEGTTEEQVRDHLNSFVDGNVCKVVTLKARGNYASFKLDVPSKMADTIMSPDNWAEDICVKPWRQSFRTQRQKTGEIQEPAEI